MTSVFRKMLRRFHHRLPQSCCETTSLRFLCLGLQSEAQGSRFLWWARPGSLKEFQNLEIWFSAVLLRILHFYQGPLLPCCIWTKETHWLYSEGKDVRYRAYESQSIENALSFPLREIDFIMLAGWALSCRSLNLGRTTPCSILSLSSGQRTQNPECKGIGASRASMFPVGASRDSPLALICPQKWLQILLVNHLESVQDAARGAIGNSKCLVEHRGFWVQLSHLVIWTSEIFRTQDSWLFTNILIEKEALWAEVVLTALTLYITSII